MIYGNYIINAEQAAQMSQKASKKNEIQNYKKWIRETGAEITRVNKEIREATLHGLTEIKIWLKFESTYNTLIAGGYTVSGGVLEEAMPESLRSAWGLEKDKFTVSWAEIQIYNLNSLNYEERVSPVLRSPGVPAEKITEPTQRRVIAVEHGDETIKDAFNPVVYNITYKLIGATDNDIFDIFDNDEYIKGVVMGGCYPTIYSSDDVIEISDLRTYFYSKDCTKLYRFDGWYFDPDGKRKISGPIKSTGGDFTVYALISCIQKK